MKSRIIISLSELNKSNWNLIYRFIKNPSNELVFNNLCEIATIKQTSENLDEDACSVADGVDLQLSSLQNIAETTFSIIYTKKDDSEDFSDLVTFFLLKKEFGDKITLGIDITNIPIKDNKQNNYVFKCSDFLKFIEDRKPHFGERSIYFIKEYVRENTGEIIKLPVSLAGKGKKKEQIVPNEDGKSKNENQASRRYLPLLKIDENIYDEIFWGKETTTIETKYITESIKKLTTTLENKKLSNNNKYGSVFEEWFIKAYFDSLAEECKTNLRGEKRKKFLEEFWGNQNINETHNLLQSYCKNIFELVQNIIFHAGKQGLLYFVFNKKENIAENNKQNIPYFDTYDLNQRFVEIGIFDYGKQGIVRKFFADIDAKKKQFPDRYTEWANELKSQTIDIKSFFDPQSILTTGLTHFELRPVAHLGIKSFVKSVLTHKGYFRVESNSDNKKQCIESVCETKDNKINIALQQNANTELDFVSGTHYEIILPVQKEEYSQKENSITFTQFSSFFDCLKDDLNKNNLPRIITVPVQEIFEKQTFTKLQKDIKTKDDQEIFITERVDAIFNHYSNINNQENIAVNLQGNNIDVGLWFKILAGIQLRKDDSFERIILTHLSDSFIETLCKIIADELIETGINPIWSNDRAIILIGKNLRVQIITGEIKDEILYFNEKINSYYFNKNFFDKYAYDDKNSIAQNSKVQQQIAKFILPYEFLIENMDFLKYVSDILESPIETENIGCKVSHKYSKIGSKIIIENYYEADFLFQNSFFVDRLAYFIAKEIVNLDYDSKNTNDKIALIGYNPYSEPLIKKIQDYIKDKFAATTTIIAKDVDNEIQFKFEENYEENIKNDYKYAVIVPIGSTLTTNDKIIAFFKQHIEREIEDNCFIYNHSTILVRDQIDETLIDPVTKITEPESNQKWKGRIGNAIITNYNNVKDKKINFLIEKAGVWKTLINEDVSFPKDWTLENPVNQTQNSSLNSQNLFSYPRVAIPPNDNKTEKNEKERNEFYKDTEAKLKELSPYIYFGHIESGRNHHRYYIDTEEFIRCKNKPLFDKWIETLKKEDCLKTNISNILITPDTNIESNFINQINEKLFGGNALVLYVDIDRWRNNIKDKFSFLQAMEANQTQPDFHFIDHALLTATSYKKTKSYILSILKEKQRKTFNFKSAITIINRLSRDRHNEISEYENVPIYSYTHLFIPPSKDPERDCSLCELEKHYDKLKERSVLEGCQMVIEKNKNKIRPRQWERYSKTNNNYEENSDKPAKIIDRDRYATRVTLKHKLLFEISNIIQNDKYNTERIENWLNTLYENEYSQEIDKKISFLKVISTPPLTHYIIMRYYAHTLLLTALSKLFAVENPNFEDFCVLKVILKQLSMLGSNALVRKDVIIGAWKLYFAVKKNLPNELEDYKKKHIDAISKLQKNKNLIKAKNNEIINNNSNICNIEREIKKNNDKILSLSKSEMFLSDNDKILICEIEDLILSLKQKITELKNTNDILTTQNNDLYKERKQLGDDIKNTYQPTLKILTDAERKHEFRSDFQFFIKNASFDDEAKSMWLGELIRTGKEIADYKNYIISGTTPNNELFKQFENEKLKKEYIEFLVWMFYDNTTIIRKTLDNFEKEAVKKNSDIEKEFYVENNNHKKNRISRKLKELDNINIVNIKNLYNEKVIEEYYYSSIKKYTNNPDKIDFVEKLSYVLYAKLKLKEINTNIEKNLSIEPLVEIAKLLLNVFAKIMDTDTAFFSMKQEKKQKKQGYTLAATDNLKDKKINYGKHSQYYTSEILMENSMSSPIRINDGNLDRYQEKNALGYNKLVCLVLQNKEENEQQNKTDIVGTITFLYNNDDGKFRTKSHEYGRLLLLLKPELDKYIKHITSEKMFDLWVEQQESKKQIEDYIARYRKNSHDARKYLNAVTPLLFDNNNLLGNPNLYALVSDLHIGNIHYSLLINKPIKFNANIYPITKIQMQLILCARKHLINACFKKENIKINFADFNNKIIYYSNETPSLLFQLVNNMIAHTQKKGKANIDIFVENEYIVFKNSYSDITNDKINDIVQNLNSSVVPHNHISLYCINHYVQNMCNNDLKERANTELSVEMQNDNSFVVKIPIIKL